MCAMLIITIKDGAKSLPFPYYKFLMETKWCCHVKMAWIPLWLSQHNIEKKFQYACNVIDEKHKLGKDQ
jgi:hypothetical protein